MSVRTKYIILGFTAAFGVMGVVFGILENPICLVFMMLMAIGGLLIILPDFIKEKKKKPKCDKCFYCGGDLIWKEDLWINEEEWGIPEDYMCTKCGKGVDLISVV